MHGRKTVVPGWRVGAGCLGQANVHVDLNHSYFTPKILSAKVLLIESYLTFPPYAFRIVEMFPSS